MLCGSRVGSRDVPLDPAPDVLDTVAKLLKEEAAWVYFFAAVACKPQRSNPKP